MDIWRVRRMGNLRKEIPDHIFDKVLRDCIDKMEGINDLDWQDIIEKYGTAPKIKVKKAVEITSSESDVIEEESLSVSDTTTLKQ